MSKQVPKKQWRLGEVERVIENAEHTLPVTWYMSKQCKKTSSTQIT